MLQAETSNPHRAGLAHRVGVSARLRAGPWHHPVLLAWQLLAFVNVINAVLLPAPLTLLWTAVDLLGDGTLIRHIGASIERVLVGVLCAAVVGLVLGVAQVGQSAYRACETDR
jgi:ABC-type nitrate/sulfonate/bicarbonate transport system permease component